MADPLPPFPPRRRPVRGALLRLTVLGLAGAGAWFGAVKAADVIEELSHGQVAAALAQGGFDWVTVETDGLRVALSGTAPDEVQRFRAIDQAIAAVDSRRLVDAIEIASPAPAAAPDFKVELLRNDAGVSLIGLVPASTDRAALVAGLQTAIGGHPVTDLLESADHPAPAGWDAALRFGLEAIEAAARSKVSVAPGQVVVTAIADGPAEKTRLEDALRRDKPAEIGLLTEISAPRPVIAPFALRMVKDETGVALEECAADTEVAQGRILAAARQAGVSVEAGCTLALGVPTPTWADAVIPAITALAGLEQGTLAFSNADVSLTAPADVPADRFDAAVGTLEAALPDVFTLTATHETPEADAEPAEFTATRTPDGVALRGVITDERMREAVESFARARFGNVESSLRIDPATPSGWTVRVIAGIETLAALEDGTVEVTPEGVALAGISGSQTAAEDAAAQLSQRLGAGVPYEFTISYDRRRDVELGLPTGQECVDQMNTVMAQSEIGFEPSSADIAGDVAPTMDLLAAAATDCEGFRIEVGGHTDSQGSENFNAELSRSRAQAVLTAMREAGIETAAMTARGYGESQPVDSNETDAGREANRRIEFKLLSDAPVVEEAPEPAQVVSGVTEDIAVVPAEVQGPNLPQDTVAAETGAEPDEGGAVQAGGEQPDADAAPADAEQTGPEPTQIDAEPTEAGAAGPEALDGEPADGDATDAGAADGGSAADAEPTDAPPPTD